jgi:hypothetical protein
MVAALAVTAAAPRSPTRVDAECQAMWTKADTTGRRALRRRSHALCRGNARARGEDAGQWQDHQPSMDACKADVYARPRPMRCTSEGRQQLHEARPGSRPPTAPLRSPNSRKTTTARGAACPRQQARRSRDRLKQRRFPDLALTAHKRPVIKQSVAFTTPTPRPAMRSPPSRPPACPPAR